MISFVRLTGLVCIALLLSACDARGPDLHIAVATNFKPVIEELGAVFDESTGYETVVSTGSTGKLYAQIENGAPYDVFLAADQERPALLIQNGTGVLGSQRTYAIGRLSLWMPGVGDPTLNDLMSKEVRFIAIANPELAPYGAAARDVLAGSGKLEALSDKLIFGENIGQAYAFLKTGNASAGLIAFSQTKSLEAGERISHTLIESSLHRSIRQDVILLRRAKENEAALKFLKFLQSAEATAIIKRYGYDVE